MPTATPATKSRPMRAGGRATEAGMAFQAAVATWFAVHILVRLPVGGRFGLNNEALPTAIRLETGTALDDIEVTQSNVGALHIQSKTSATLDGREGAARQNRRAARHLDGGREGCGRCSGPDSKRGDPRSQIGRRPHT